MTFTSNTWDESKHPRDNEGKFTYAGGCSSSKSNEDRIRKEIEEKARMQKAADILYPTMRDDNKNNGMCSINKNEVGKLGGDVLDNVPAGLRTNVCQNEKNTNTSKYTKPVEGKIKSDYGPRTAPVPGASREHKGVDIAVPIGTSVKTISDGKVIVAGEKSGYGNAVYIDHGVIDGKRIISEYGHLNRFSVKVGDTVKQGQEIAKSGNSGRSSGPHLHLTIKENGVAVDPKKYIDF